MEWRRTRRESTPSHTAEALRSAHLSQGMFCSGSVCMKAWIENFSAGMQEARTGDLRD